MRRFAWIVLAATFFPVRVHQNRQGGPPPVYRTDAPASDLDVIAGVPTRDSIHLSVRSATDRKVKLTYHEGSNESKSLEVDLIAAAPKDVTIDGLKPGTRYEYAIDGADAHLQGKFTTAKREGESFVFDIQADSHLDGNSSTKVYENTLANMNRDGADFLVDLGDTFMVDKYTKYTDSLKQYQAQRYWFSRIGSQMSVFLCLGNHDGEVGWRQRGGESSTDWAQGQRQRYFPTVKANAFYSGAPAVGLYYAWTWGDAQFIVLDPFVATTRKPRSDEDGWNWTLGAKQFRWFQSVLESSKSKYKFIFIHHLVGGFGKEARGGVEAVDRFEWGDSKEFPNHRSGWAEPIHALMKKYRVTAMFHGHDHLYVRQERDGIAYIEVPQPSHERGDSISSAEEYGYKSGRLLGSSGHVRVTVSASGAKMEYVKSRLSGKNREVVDSIDLAPAR